MRRLTTKNVKDKKPSPPVIISNKVLSKAIGKNAEIKGCWICYGIQKNGKTTVALTLAQAIAPNHAIDYISAEEGVDGSFQSAMDRVGITNGDKIGWREYLPLTELIAVYKKPKSAKVIIIDNLTIYADEFKDLKMSFVEFLRTELPNKLIIAIAHEERGEPYPTIAKMAVKLAKVILHVQGLAVTVVSRYGDGGGEFLIDKQKASLYWGDTDKDEL